ncbi:hypothetical protein AVEN_61275-1 [Araneus ventricosus]|uniref:Uncharacterized protein n=1 Tax=Araneus ventricosus TaxID=182803 RepID=A0A4Y2N4A8_ARAVE|nr:hypothetical protein AVEN_61275-1 [Araneus ventricosus]
MIRLFLRVRRITVQLCTISRREHGNFGRKIFIVVRKSDPLKDKVDLRCSTSKSSSLSKIVKQKLQLFDSTENISSNIIKLGEDLKTIPPTSSEDERAFSASELFITKLLYSWDFPENPGKNKRAGNQKPYTK